MAIKLQFFPTGNEEKRTKVPVYGPQDTGCPAVERAIAALYGNQTEETFWTLASALNYALQMETRVLVPLAADTIPTGWPVSWADDPVPPEKAKKLPLWTLESARGGNFLPIFTSAQEVENAQCTALRPVTELLLGDALVRALDDKSIAGAVINPWSKSATLDKELIRGLLRDEGDDTAGVEETEQGKAAIQEGKWEDAIRYFQDAVKKGRIEAVTQLGYLLYAGHGGASDKQAARSLWRKAAECGDVQAYLALGDDCALTNKGDGAALHYYRGAQKLSHRSPDIAYTPRTCMCIALFETQFISRERAMLQLAEAVQGFEILAKDGEPNAAAMAEDCRKSLQQLLDANT